MTAIHTFNTSYRPSRLSGFAVTHLCRDGFFVRPRRDREEVALCLYRRGRIYFKGDVDMLTEEDIEKSDLGEVLQRFDEKIKDYLSDLQFLQIQIEGLCINDGPTAFDTFAGQMQEKLDEYGALISLRGAIIDKYFEIKKDWTIEGNVYRAKQSIHSRIKNQ